MLPRPDPSRQAPAADWDGPYGCVKVATWYQEVLNWLILPAHYLLNWQGSGIWACSCAAHTVCGTAGKHPALPYQHLEAPLPLHTLRAFWIYGKRLPYNVSLLTGHRSGVAVADLDAKPVYSLSVGERLSLLREAGWPVDETCAERSGGGGLHIFASVPRDLRVPSRSVYLADGIELFASALARHRVLPAISQLRRSPGGLAPGCLAPDLRRERGPLPLLPTRTTP